MEDVMSVTVGEASQQLEVEGLRKVGEKLKDGLSYPPCHANLNCLWTDDSCKTVKILLQIL